MAYSGSLITNLSSSARSTRGTRWTGRSLASLISRTPTVALDPSWSNCSFKTRVSSITTVTCNQSNKQEANPLQLVTCNKALRVCVIRNSIPVRGWIKGILHVYAMEVIHWVSYRPTIANKPNASNEVSQLEHWMRLYTLKYYIQYTLL